MSNKYLTSEKTIVEMMNLSKGQSEERHEFESSVRQCLVQGWNNAQAIYHGKLKIWHVFIVWILWWVPGAWDNTKCIQKNITCVRNMNSCHNEHDSIVRMEYVIDWAVNVDACRQMGRINALNGSSVVSMPGSYCCSRLNSLQMMSWGKTKKPDNGEGWHQVLVLRTLRQWAAGIQ